jgi:hypothetical protein
MIDFLAIPSATQPNGGYDGGTVPGRFVTGLFYAQPATAGQFFVTTA